MIKKWDFVSAMTMRVSLTPRFIEVLAGEALMCNCFKTFGSPDKPGKRFRTVGSAHNTNFKVGVNEKTIPRTD